ncbi:MAG: chemotaxis protein CheY [Gammaproteobacteria bacterium SG8_30]|nr:MAG: chemotaxis protein CheY [Gammaproteobacteria bacterium SG8_30]
MRVLVVDDEPPARERLKQLLAELPDTELAGEAGSGEEALAVAAEARPDVVLLDIRMPGMGGLEAARHLASLTDPPAVVFTTAYEQHALEAFDAQASGYLLKPIRRERLASALERLRRPTRAQRTVTTEPGKARTHVTARVRDQLKLIPVRDVLCFVAEQKYTTVRHVAGEDLIEDSLRSLEREFPDEFIRVHRNALVAIEKIESLDREPDGRYAVRLRHGGGTLQVSRRLAAEVLRRLR